MDVKYNLPRSKGGTSFDDLGYSRFSETETYAKDDVVIYSGSLYKFTASHSGAWTGNDAEATSIEELIKDGGGGNGHSPYIGQNGNWYEWDEETKQFVDTEVQAQGPQGNTGSSVDYPFELVNNLTTDDETKALSAKMGKKLKESINGIFVDVEEDGLFFVDNSFRIGAKIDSNGLHAINILEFEIQNL